MPSRRSVSWLAPLALTLSLGCAHPSRLAPWIPALALSARGSTAVTPTRASDRWEVEAGLRWRLGAARPSPAPTLGKPPRPLPEGPPCLDPTICRWARRARARALARAR